jgi:ATP-dependent Clp protease ATP-binding subunit ClpA
LPVTASGGEARRASPRGAQNQVRFAEELAQRVIGQSAAVKTIAPWLDVHYAGLSPEGRPAGVFLLLGPTGTGKTRTVEAIADILHGSPRKLLRVDCGEFALEHEVARLIGAPPGYLGHRETPAYLSRDALRSQTSLQCDLSILLFDEIEKAAPSMTRLLLGILDKGVLRLGDNTAVNFEKTLIFFTSNLGAAKMSVELGGGFGFAASMPGDERARERRIEKIGMRAVRKRFTPEFVNRIDSIITYAPLDRDALEMILDLLLDELQQHIDKRLGARSFRLNVGARARAFLLGIGASDEYGARELKRTLQRSVVQPMASLIASGRVAPESVVDVRVNGGRVVLECQRCAA